MWNFQVVREGYGIVRGAVYFCVDDVLDKFDGVVGDPVDLRAETQQHRDVLGQKAPEGIQRVRRGDT